MTHFEKLLFCSRGKNEPTEKNVSFLWMGFNCLKATEALQRDSLLCTTKFPEIPGTPLIDLGRMKG